MSRIVALLALFALLSGCYYFPYDEDALAGALLSDELTEVATIGPAPIEFVDDEPPTGEFFPYLPLGSGGYMTHTSQDRLTVYHFSASGGREIATVFFDENQILSPYVVTTVSEGVAAGNVPPVFFAEAGNFFGPLKAFTPEGLVAETSVATLLNAEFASGEARIVGMHFWNESDGTPQLTVLARDLDAASFKEADFVLNAAGTISGPTFPAAGTFTLPNLTDDIIIYNGVLLVDPVNGLTYFTVQDDENEITYRWSPTDPPGTRVTVPISGTPRYVTRNGTVLSRDGNELVEYESDGGEIDRFTAGSMRAIGSYWEGSGFIELYSSVGPSRGLPDRSATVGLYRR